jgi:hypothetical protein
MENSASKSSYKSDEKEWTDLWSAKVPSKVRNFLWRFARHSLPTADVRHHRHMTEESVCTLRGSEDSWKHPLLECNMARCVWALEGEEMLELLQSFQLSDAKSWLAEMLHSLAFTAHSCGCDTLGNLACEEEGYSQGDLSKPVINQMIC